MTEMVTGVDLIQEQIKVAMGGVLPFKQSDIQLRVRIPPATTPLSHVSQCMNDRILPHELRTPQPQPSMHES